MSLGKYILRRLIASVPVLLGAITITFFLTRMMPGDPIIRLLGVHYTDEAAASLRTRYGFDLPPVLQFFVYLKNLFTGDWGQSIVIQKNRPVMDMIWERFPRTIELTVLAVLISSLIGIKSGVISATNRNKPKDTVIRSFSLAGVALPVFWLGLIFQLVFGYILQILPVYGYLDSGLVYQYVPITGFILIDTLIQGQFYMFWDHLLHLVMPVACLTIIEIAQITRQTRSSMLEVLELDYIRTARAKGCSEKDVINMHALRNSMIPTTTVIGMNVAGLLGGAVLTETLFNFKGIGMLITESITGNIPEYWLLQAAVFIMTLIFIVVNLFTDILYGILDPRIRFE